MAAAATTPSDAALATASLKLEETVRNSIMKKGGEADERSARAEKKFVKMFNSLGELVLNEDPTRHEARELFEEMRDRVTVDEDDEHDTQSSKEIVRSLMCKKWVECMSEFETRIMLRDRTVFRDIEATDVVKSYMGALKMSDLAPEMDAHVLDTAFALTQGMCACARISRGLDLSAVPGIEVVRTLAGES